MLFVAASGDQDAENGARLTCHILLRLFKTSDMTLTSPSLRPGSKGQCNIKRSCDKHLLAAAHDSITVGPVLAVLKAMLVLSKDIIGILMAQLLHYMYLYIVEVYSKTQSKQTCL